MKHIKTISYHPQANGLVERFHGHLKSALRERLTDPNWIDELPWVLLGIRTAPKEDLHTSSAELVYGAPLTVPGDFVTAPNTTASPDILLHTLHRKVKVSCRYLHPNMAHNRHQFLPICTAVSMFLSVCRIGKHES